MRTENTKIPLITLAILAISAFVPIIQIILIYLNGAFVYLFDFINSYSIINIIGSIGSLIGYYFASKARYLILWMILLAFFLIPLLLTASENFQLDIWNPYFLGYLIIALIVSVPMYIIGILKERII